LLVFAIRLERCAGVLRVVKAALEALVNGQLTDAEAARALVAPGFEAVPLTRASIRTASRAAKAWRAAELAAALRRADPAAALRCDATRAIIDGCTAIRQRYPIRPLPAELPRSTRPSRRATSSASPSLLASSASPPLLADRSLQAAGPRSAGANADGSFWNVKKRPQLLLMGGQVEALLHAHPEWGQRPLRILDIGGGKGLFAEYLARTFGDAVSVTLVDVVGKRLAQARARMARRGGTVPPNLELVLGDAAALAARGELARVDVACGMHACGGLSDLIIAHAVEQGAAFAVSTCCFHSNMQLAIPGDVPRDDWLARGGGAAAVSTEQRSHIHTLLRTAELTDSPAAAHESAHAINAMRAAAAEASWAATWAESRLRPPRLRAEVVQYDAKFSARNQIVVGRPAWGVSSEI
jgi:SAM-dependent methyltransferase